MKLSLLAAALAGATPLVDAPQSAAPIVHGLVAATDAVLAAEKRYSARFAHGTVAGAMCDFIADDALAFTGGGDPVRGPAAACAAFGGAAPSTLHLTWLPSEVSPPPVAARQRAGAASP